MSGSALADPDTCEMGMELSGTLSNPALPLELGRVALHKRALDSREPRPAPASTPRASITVASTVRKILADAAQPMHAKQIHTACEAELCQRVPLSTVQTCLTDHSKGTSPRFTRIRRGLYTVAR